MVLPVFNVRLDLEMLNEAQHKLIRTIRELTSLRMEVISIYINILQNMRNNNMQLDPNFERAYNQ